MGNATAVLVTAMKGGPARIANVLLIRAPAKHHIKIRSAQIVVNVSVENVPAASRISAHTAKLPLDRNQNYVHTMMSASAAKSTKGSTGSANPSKISVK